MMLNTNGNLTDQGNKVFEAIWWNESLRESLFGENIPNTPEAKRSSKKKLSQWIKVLDSRFFKFIKIK